MASRLNLLFSTAPRQFLERTVLFSDELITPESSASIQNRDVLHVDLQPLGTRATARILPGLHLYQDTPLTSYLLHPLAPTLIPKEDTPFRFVFLPEFSASRLLVSAAGEKWLQLHFERGLSGRMPAPEKQADSKYLDSFAYWDYTGGNLVGNIRATAVLAKQPGGPWTAYMQQIVGVPGHEQVRMLFSKQLCPE
jgi:hypothetical protein